MKKNSLHGGFWSRYIGDKAFYTMVLGLVLPMMLQDAITNFVGLLDNIMVGQTGTEQMSGVAIANQLLLVYNMSLFGGNGGAGIFGAQFHGRGDPAGVRHTLRYKLIMGLVLTAAAMLLFVFWDEQLIGMFLHESAEGGDLALTLASGRAYLRVMLFGMVPFAAAQAYATTLREMGETGVPMKAGIAAVFVNLAFNFLLIYPTRTLTVLGLSFKMPGAGWGVAGAAVATVLSRFVELAVVVVWAHTHTARFPCFQGLWRSLRLPGRLAGDITVKGMPLMVNELLYTLVLTLINQCYSMRGLTVVAAGLIIIIGIFTPMHAFLQCCYFTLRCGGKTGVTFVFDCAFICFGNLPLAYCLAHFTGINILWMYACVQLFDLTKCAFGFAMVKKGVWINNLVEGSVESASAVK